MRESKITSTGIKNNLKGYNIETAIGEFVANGFDADATTVTLTFTTDEFDNITELVISDNGYGIAYEALALKFEPILESEKAIKKKEDRLGVFGRNGQGRFTFFKFAHYAHWETVYQKDNTRYSYGIKISAEQLNFHDPSKPITVGTNVATGTKVTFNQLNRQLTKQYFDKYVRIYLIKEFAWYLQVNKNKGLKLIIDNQLVDPDSQIAETENFPETIYFQSKTKLTFNCQFILWNNKQLGEYSRFYFINNSGKLKHQTTTKLNNKGDNFYHSIIVESSFFDGFVYEENHPGDAAPKLFSLKDDKEVYDELVVRLNEYLRKKRKPFLHKHAEVLLDSYKKEGVLPEFGSNSWDEVRKDQFETLVKELYEVEPALFVKLNFEQKKTFLNLLNLILDSGEREGLFKILESVVDLETEERKHLAELLRANKLQNIVKTLRLVHDRIIVLERLREVVFNHELKANEVEHLQTIIQEHYWIFGEEYNFVCAADVGFDKALRNYIYLLRGEKKQVQTNHINRFKQMDLFVSGQQYRGNSIENLVIEIKNPSTIKKLTTTQLGQLETYQSTILGIDEFNAVSNTQWKFLLIGQDYDGNISDKIENARPHGENNLVAKAKNYRTYVYKWSEIIAFLEIRLRWLNEKLMIEREKLVSPAATIDDVMTGLVDNTAKSSGTNESFSHLQKPHSPPKGVRVKQNKKNQK
jgi:hypothetical protein